MFEADTGFMDMESDNVYRRLNAMQPQHRLKCYEGHPSSAPAHERRNNKTSGLEPANVLCS